MPVSEDGETVLADTLTEQTIPAPNEFADQIALAEELHEALEHLPKREVLILEKHYGLLDGESHTLQTIGNELGVTRERIWQLEQRALHKLRTLDYLSLTSLRVVIAMFLNAGY
jgi:RNA polymerase primary sigma factor